MAKFLLDAGTSWSKVFEIYKDNAELENSPMNEFVNYCSSENQAGFCNEDKEHLGGRTFIFPSGMLAKTGLLFDAATGHMVKKLLKPDGNYVNEVIALAYGTKKIMENEQDLTVVDLGSRDVKWIKFVDGKYKDLDWNGSCGSATGATVEMLCRFYGINPSEIPVVKDKYPVTCGVFAMEKIMDDIASDVPAETAIAKYIHGIAYNTWSFSGMPKKLYLSGGFCMNKCFVKSLELYCETVVLGRYVLLQGLFQAI